jgi:hypothetical protein
MRMTFDPDPSAGGSWCNIKDVMLQHYYLARYLISCEVCISYETTRRSGTNTSSDHSLSDRRITCRHNNSRLGLYLPKQ